MFYFKSKKFPEMADKVKEILNSLNKKEEEAKQEINETKEPIVEKEEQLPELARFERRSTRISFRKANMAITQQNSDVDEPVEIEEITHNSDSSELEIYKSKPMSLDNIWLVILKLNHFINNFLRLIFSLQAATQYTTTYYCKWFRRNGSL
jgi:hypothetical protein